ncbi:MAG TPA: PKD domain-containing protein, partial [Chitinophagales bacterium]|nr:PKD domain-containing protein [Chitinophagales bacterium]
MNMLFAAGFDSLSGMTYHWEHSSVGCSGPWSNIDSSAMLFFNDWYLVLPFGQTNLYGWYRITATCLNSGLSSTSNCFYYDATTTTSYCPAWYSYIASGNGLNIHFTPYSASPGTYAWDFGDGNTSSDPSPSHQYAANGVYNVCLTYTDIDGNACSYCNTVNAVATAMLNGLVYNDENQNGQHDSGEPGIPNQTVSANGFGTAYTDSSGHYTVQVPLGTYDLQFNPFNTNPTAWSLTTPSSGTYSVDANDTVTFDGFDFGVYVDPNYHDVSVEMSCENPVSGFWNYNNYIVKNTGFTAEDVTLVVTYDSVLAYTQGFPSPSAVDAISRTLTYNLQALPGDTYFFVEYQCAIGTPLLTAVYNHVAVTLNGATDINLSNNTATCQTAVVGSYDPNDKQVNPAGLGVNNAVHPNDVDELTYRVRFQNTGTAPAYFITVLDTLDDSVLDVTSFQFLEHSHPCQVQIT